MQSDPKKKVLITGGLGHIGSDLIRCLHNCDIYVVDNLCTQRYCSLGSNWTSADKFTFWDCDFLDVCDRLPGFDTIIHLAADTDAAGSMSNPALVRKRNVHDTKKFIDLANAAGVKRFIFPSSTSVYGKAVEVMREGEDNLAPQSPYAESKLEVECYLRHTGLDHVIFRFGTIVGRSPGMRFHTAINRFCYQASLGKPLTVWRENYHQKRPYLVLPEATKALAGAIWENGLLNDTFNVVTANIELSAIVETIRQEMQKSGGDVEVEFADTPLLNQHSYEVDDTKFRVAAGAPKGSAEKVTQYIKLSLGFFARIRPDSK